VTTHIEFRSHWIDADVHAEIEFEEDASPSHNEFAIEPNPVVVALHVGGANLTEHLAEYSRLAIEREAIRALDKRANRQLALV
jgi:hypothetical protein